MTPIRLALEGDIPQLCGLLAELFAQEAEFSPDAEVQACGLRTIIASPDTGSILVAGEPGHIIGMVSLLYLTSTALGGRVAQLEDMVVAAGYRGAGLGDRLLDAAIDHARAAGCRRITLLTDGGNADAQRFYMRHGFVRSGMLPMRLLLDRVGRPLT
ncbi:MAG TPA: GNAT family N-acetyltransferase [Methyloversatilis sp.]